MLVEHQIVRPLQRMLAAFVDHGLDLAALRDRRAGSSRRYIRPADGGARHQGAARRNPAKAAIVADVHLAVGAERRAIGAAGNFRDHLLAPVRPDPRQPPAADFDQHHRPVRHDHRAFRKLQTGGDNANICHEILPACFGCRRIPSLDPARATCRCACYGKGDHACQATTGYRAAQGSPAARFAAPKRLSRGPGSRFPARHCRCWNRTSRHSARSSARRRLSCPMPAASDSRSC